MGIGNLSLFVLLLVGLATAGAEQPAADPYCGCGLDKKFGMPDGWDSTDIWIDVVIILDTSEAMGEVSLVDASTLIESFIGTEDGDVLTTNTTSEFYTRIGLIAMSDTAEVLFNLNMTKDDKVLDKLQIKKGLNQINVLELASPGYYYTDIQDNYMSTIQLFCKANCYCRPDMDRTAYHGNNTDPTLRASGGCFRAVPAGYQFSNARRNCDELGGGLLASIHDDDKANFVQQLMYKAAPKSDYFWIGYQKSDAGWGWEDKSTDPYTNWDTANGEPNSASVAKCAYVDSTTPGLYWGAGNCNVGFPSVCEFAPCAVGNANC